MAGGTASASFAVSLRTTYFWTYHLAHEHQ